MPAGCGSRRRSSTSPMGQRDPVCTSRLQRGDRDQQRERERAISSETPCHMSTHVQKGRARRRHGPGVHRRSRRLMHRFQPTAIIALAWALALGCGGARDRRRGGEPEPEVELRPEPETGLVPEPGPELELEPGRTEGSRGPGVEAEAGLAAPVRLRCSTPVPREAGGASADASIPADAAAPQDRWVTTWGTSMIDLGLFATTWFDDVTVRQIVDTSVGGCASACASRTPSAPRR